MTPQERARKGGLARAAKLTADQRSESARKAVLARWAKMRCPMRLTPGTVLFARVAVLPNAWPQIIWCGDGSWTTSTIPTITLTNSQGGLTRSSLA